MNPDPFEALGLPARPDLTDEQVRAAWRAIAAATHPDRADGGDLARYTAASAAYAELRTPWGRSEAYADLLQQAELDGEARHRAAARHPGRRRAVRRPAAASAGRSRGSSRPGSAAAGPRRLLLRAVIAAVLSLAVLQLIPGTAAAPADITGLVVWFVLTGRRDLAPPPER